jgi:uncharacterized protein (DUF924 family)
LTLPWAFEKNGDSDEAIEFSEQCTGDCYTSWIKSTLQRWFTRKDDIDGAIEARFSEESGQ